MGAVGVLGFERDRFFSTRATRSCGPVERASREAGLRRHVAVYMPQFSASPQLLAASDLLLTAPQAVFARSVQAYDLVALQVPIELAPTCATLHVRAALARDPALQLLRDAITQSFATQLQLSAAIDVIPLRSPKRRPKPKRGRAQPAR